MKMKNTLTMILAAATSATLSPLSAVVPEVSSVVMTQSRMSRLVTITYTLSDAPAVITLDVQTNANTSAAADDPGWTSIDGKAVSSAEGDVWKKVAPDLTEGNSFNGTISWRPDLSWPDHKIPGNGARAVVTAWALDNTPDYMVVDVSYGALPNTQKYYPAVEFLPGGLLSNDVYRTSSIVMRKIMAKGLTWTMGSTSFESAPYPAREKTHQVTLTNNYYMGVFEVTQDQWVLVATNSQLRGSFTVEPAMRPMENVCYNEIRLQANSGAAVSTDVIANYSWPKAPRPSSFLGLLRLKTGIDFDLPSDAQWEFAARAGNGDTKWGDGTSIKNGDKDENLNRLGRNKYNGGWINNADAPTTCGPTNGTSIVGTYDPNSWGLYDVHGNVAEWCLDWYEENIATAKDASGELYGGRVNVDPDNPANFLSGASASGANRVVKSGFWTGAASLCRPAYRTTMAPTTRGKNLGFRVYCTAGLQ